jgi:hypothetical protein
MIEDHQFSMVSFTYLVMCNYSKYNNFKLEIYFTAYMSMTIS